MLLSEYLGLGFLLDHRGVFDPDLKVEANRRKSASKA